MARGIAQNFAPSSQVTKCPLGCSSSDTQQHLLQCPVLLVRLTAAEGEVRNISNYDDIYGDVEGQLRLAPVLRRLLEIREDLLQPPPSGCSCLPFVQGVQTLTFILRSTLTE